MRGRPDGARNVRGVDWRPLVPAFIIVVLARVAALVVLHLWSHHAGYRGYSFIATGEGDDGIGYYAWASGLSRGRSHHSIHNAFPSVLSVFMRLGIRDLFALKIVNTVVGLVTPLLAAVMVGRCVEAGDRRRRAQIAAILVVGLYPTNVWVSENSLVRDGWIIALVMATALLFGRTLPPLLAWSGWRRLGGRPRTALTGDAPDRWWPFGLAVPILLLLAWFRFYAAAVMVGGLGLFLVWSLYGRAVRISPRARLWVAPASFVAFFTIVTIGRWPIEQLFGHDPLGYRADPDLAGDSSLGLTYTNNPIRNLGVYLYSVVSNAFAPLPWQIDKPSMLVAFLVEIPLFIAIVVVLYRSNSQDWTLSMRLWSVTALLWLATLGIFNDNLGAAVRLRAPAWLLLTVCAAATLRVRAPAAVQRTPEPVA